MAGSCEEKCLKIKPELNWQGIFSQCAVDMKSPALHASGKQGRETALKGTHFCRITVLKRV